MRLDSRELIVKLALHLHCFEQVRELLFGHVDPRFPIHHIPLEMLAFFESELFEIMQHLVRPLARINIHTFGTVLPKEVTDHRRSAKPTCNLAEHLLAFDGSGLQCINPSRSDQLTCIDLVFDVLALRLDVVGLVERLLDLDRSHCVHVLCKAVESRLLRFRSLGPDCRCNCGRQHLCSNHPDATCINPTDSILAAEDADGLYGPGVIVLFDALPSGAHVVPELGGHQVVGLLVCLLVKLLGLVVRLFNPRHIVVNADILVAPEVLAGLRYRAVSLGNSIRHLLAELRIHTL